MADGLWRTKGRIGSALWCRTGPSKPWQGLATEYACNSRVLAIVGTFIAGDRQGMACCTKYASVGDPR